MKKVIPIRFDGYMQSAMLCRIDKAAADRTSRLLKPKQKIASECQRITSEATSDYKPLYCRMLSVSG
ncbi:hypothetical protein GS399_03180 [Pedobacter sp. HMF7647]|uniref:Uncharacterized protein n=1 Tax=Hufsiella arboris TaxID=2695275 RepID=A0A7K1Y6C3_9SPHI|nr:hypothetical protein [Hufsiella arboris]MXV49961.1 hypothetical protein [Hufsiella arboris]